MGQCGMCMRIDENEQQLDELDKEKQRMANEQKGKQENAISPIEAKPEEELPPIYSFLKDVRKPEDSVFPLNLYRNDELETFKYITKELIIKFIDVQFEDETYKPLYEKDDIKFAIKNESPLNKTCPFIRLDRKVSKKIFHDKEMTVPKLVHFLYDQDHRRLWDKNNQEYKVMEQNDQGFRVVHVSMNKPVFFMSKRDLIDKQFKFFDGDYYYSYSASVKDDYMPYEEDCERILEVVAMTKMWEDNEFIYIRSASQNDMKVSIPTAFLSMGLPSKVNEHYSRLFKYANSVYDKEHPGEYAKSDSDSDD